jgi:hypothetical protein
MIWPPQQDFRGQVPAPLATEGANNHKWLKRKLIHPSRNIAPAPLALDNEQFPFLDSKSHSRITIGEN